MSLSASAVFPSSQAFKSFLPKFETLLLCGRGVGPVRALFSLPLPSSPPLPLLPRLRELSIAGAVVSDSEHDEPMNPSSLLKI